MVDRSTMGVGPFFWLGGRSGQALSNIGNKVARHTKGDQSGHKAPLEAIRIVNHGQLQRIESMAALAICLFGDRCGPMGNISETEKASRLEEHTTQLQALMTIQYADFSVN